MQRCFGFRKRIKKIDRNEAKKKISSILNTKKDKIKVKQTGAIMREGMCALSENLKEKFEEADKICLDLFGHPLQIIEAPKGVRTPISYKDGALMFKSNVNPAQMLGGIVFELNNALNAERFKQVEKEGSNGTILKKKLTDYGIDDEESSQAFDELQTSEERQAFVQEYIEWDHMMKASLKEQKEISDVMGLIGENEQYTNYIVTFFDGSKEAEKKGYSVEKNWQTFMGYLSVTKEHYDAVLKTIRESKEGKKNEGKQKKDEDSPFDDVFSKFK